MQLLKLVDYLHVLADNSWYNYYITGFLSSSTAQKAQSDSSIRFGSEHYELLVGINSMLESIYM